MNIADKLRKVLEIKNNIKAALEEKGIQDVGNDFSNYAENIANIKGGGDEPEEPEIPGIPEPPVIEIPELPKYEDVYAEALASIPEQEPWVQPEDWIDLRTVLEDNVIEEYPYRIAMMVEDSESMNFYFHSKSSSDLSNILKPDYILCSNRTDYDAENISQGMVHTWDGEAENGYRWVIFYFKTQSIAFPIEKYKTIQVILDGIAVNAYSNISINNSANLIATSTSFRLNLSTVSIESINGGNIYSYDKPYSWSTNYYSIFDNRFNLVYIGEGVINGTYTSRKYLFRNCFSLKYIPSLKNISFADKNCESMFSGCKSLVSIPELNTTGVTSFWRMFQNCSSLITIPLIDTSKGTSFTYMFSGCSSLVTIPELDFSSAVDVTNMFQNCYSLVTIPELNTTNVTNFGGMFSSCSSLITISGLNTSSGIDMTGMFSGCSSLVTIPELNTTNVTIFSSLFRDCSSLVTIPELNTSKGTSFYYMFSDCSSLVTIPELDFSSATSIEGIFANTTSLEVLPQLNLQLLTTSGLKFGKSFKYIKGINAPLITGFDSSFFSNSVYIGRLDCPKVSKYSFAAKDLKYIEYIDTTSLTDCSNMFSGCSSLTTIPELNTSNCTNFSSLFRDCSSLVTIPELNTSNGTDFRYIFQNCSSLKSIPLIDTTNGTNFSYMFQNCYSLVTIPELNTTNGTNFSYMFDGCSSLVTIPEIDTANGTDFSYIFRECKSVTTVPLLNTIKGANMTGMFYNCSSLITIPELNFSSATKISYFINNCPRLEIVPSIYLTNPNLTSISYLIYGTNNIKKFGDLIFPYITYTSSLFYQSSFNKCSEVGTFDLSSYPSGSNTVNIPANPELIKKVKIVGGALKRQIDFSSSFIPIYVRDYEVGAIDCNMNLNYWVALTKQSLLNILNALVPLEGTTRTLTLNENYHIPLLTNEEIAIATNKGWTISEGTFTLS